MSRYGHGGSSRRCGWHVLVFLVVFYAGCGVAVSETLLRLNCGGPAFVDSQGQAWTSDASAGSVSSPATVSLLAGTRRNRNRSIQVDPAELPLYQYEVNGDRIHYQIDLSGLFSTATANHPTVSVTLFFTEPQGTRTAGMRTFDVFLQGALVAPDFDIFVAAGGKHLATSLSFPNVALPNSNHQEDQSNSNNNNTGVLLHLELQSNQGSDVALLHGIVISTDKEEEEEEEASDAPSTVPTTRPTTTRRSVLPTIETAAPTATPTSPVREDGPRKTIIRLNCGGVAFVDSAGHEWQDDRSSTYRKQGVRRNGYQDYQGVLETDEPLYDMRAEGDAIRYEIDLAAMIESTSSTVTVQLHFAEPLNNRPVGTRVFDIFIQGALVQADWDVMAAAGAKWTPVVLEFPVLVPGAAAAAGQVLVIEFQATRDVAIVNGIAVLSSSSSSSSSPQGNPPAVTVAPTPTVVAAAPPTAGPTVSPSAATATASPTLVAPTTSVPTRLAAPNETTTPDMGPALLRLNCGGIAFTDSAGDDWQDDRSSTYRVLGVRRNGYQDYAAEQADQPLYDMRAEGDVIRYEITIIQDAAASFEDDSQQATGGNNNNNKFHVQLHFAEPMNNRPVGTRIFHIWIQGSLVAADVDVMQVAGDKWIPLVLGYDTLVAPGTPLVIEFEAVRDVAIVNGIVVRSGHKWTTTTTTQHEGTSPTTAAPSVAPSWGAGVVGWVPTPVPTTAAPTVDHHRRSEGYVKRLNVCGPTVYDENNNAWENDDLQRRRSSAALSTTHAIHGAALLESIYQTACEGQSLGWRIDNLPQGDYNIVFHFAETDARVGIGERLFDIEADAVLVVTGIDVAATVGPFAAFTQISYVPSVTDGRIDIRCNMALESTYRPMVAALEIIQNLPHLSHAVPGGPYMAVARESQGTVPVPVDGIESHTHGSGAFIRSWKWFFDGSLIAQGAMVDLALPVGTHSITLQVEDSDGSRDSATTTVVVQPKGYPFIDVLTPDSGEIGNADYNITLRGVGFLGANLVVHFGPVNLHGDNSTEITIVSDTELILNPAIPSVRTTTGPVFIYVETDIGVSNTLTFTQYDEPFFFDAFDIIDGATNQPYYIFQPTCLAFGPDDKLYVGTRAGALHKLTIDENWIVTEAIVSTAVSDQSNVEDGYDRAILGMTFDPLDVSDAPTIYISTSILNHRESVAWVGRAISGRIVAVTGPSMDTLTNVVTGLPLLDRDHSVSGIEFGDRGELYINNGGNTNAGVPGAMSIGTGTQEEGYLSGACNVAHLSRPAFDGHVTYDAVGNKIGGIDVEVFASGTRNPYDLVLHSNGFLYGTDNGPNTPYGPASLDCNTEGWDKPEAPDELNLIEYNKYYGHPNRKRGEEDSRQCTYHHSSEVSNGDHTAPMATLPSSVDGIVEFKSNHFGGSMRGQLVIGQFKGVMFRVALTPDGRGVANNEVIPFLAFGGLDVTQAPNGALMSVRYHEDKLLVQVPKEEAVTGLEIKSVFPHRGHLSGGSTLSVYGVNMDTGSTPTVTVGGDPCTAVTVLSSSKLTCKLPARLLPGKANVVVDNGLVMKTFTEAYRYISGVEE